MYYNIIDDITQLEHSGGDNNKERKGNLNYKQKKGSFRVL
jgi:hypothetical protein